MELGSVNQWLPKTTKTLVYHHFLTLDAIDGPSIRADVPHLVSKS